MNRETIIQDHLLVLYEESVSLWHLIHGHSFKNSPQFYTRETLFQAFYFRQVHLGKQDSLPSHLQVQSYSFTLGMSGQYYFYPPDSHLNFLLQRSVLGKHSGVLGFLLPIHRLVVCLLVWQGEILGPHLPISQILQFNDRRDKARKLRANSHPRVH